MRKKIVAARAAACAMMLAMAATPSHAQEESSPRVERFAHCGGFLEGATFDREGRLWVVDYMGGAISSVDKDGRCTKRGESGGKPNGARFHKDGRLFIADNVLGIIAVDTATMKKTVIVDSYRGERITSANDLAFDAAGGLYFTDPRGSNALTRNGRVFYLPPGGKELQLIADNLAFPNGIAVSADGEHVLVGELRDKAILKLPAVLGKSPFKGAYTHVRTLSGMGPDGMTLAADGRLYWAEFDGASVGVALSSGQVLPSIPLGEEAGSFVTNVALRDGWLYATEASKGEVWRIWINPENRRAPDKQP